MVYNIWVPIYKEVNKNFFKKWSPEMAYVLGFIFADGNIIYTKRATWFWSLQINDREILEKIKTTLNSSHIISKKKKYKNEKQSYRLQIGSKEMCADLIKLGLTERKSKTLLFPEIPEKYFPSFLRGYFDGDGGVWVGFKNKHRKHKIYAISVTFTSGSRKFLVSLKKILSKHRLLGGSLVSKERGFDLKYSIKDSLILYKIMYNGSCTLFLKRKREKFENYIK
ncbi:MAG: LAGLIDADG family homing endonuclease [bacterium]|nr:LAGLIDADG family homing endonuclease [bacterium]